MNDEIALERLEREWVAALVRGDTATLERIWDSSFVFTDPRGQSLSRDDCLRDLASGALRIAKAEVRSLHCHAFGDTGVVLGTIALSGWSGAAAYDGEYSFVDVYSRRHGEWRAVLSSGDLVAPLTR